MTGRAPDTPPGCPREFDWTLAAAEPQTPGARALSDHAASCPRCAARLAAREGERALLAQRHPFEEFRAAVEARVAQGARRRRLALRLVPALAACAALVAGLALWPAPRPAPGDAGGLRTKGSIGLRFYVQRGAESEPGVSGGEYHENERIQFTYSSGPHRFLFLVSLDERGRVSNFNHRGEPRSVAIAPGEDRVLEGSIILDSATGYERVFAVFSDRPLAYGEVRRAAETALAEAVRAGRTVRDLERLPLPWPQASILLLKR